MNGRTTMVRAALLLWFKLTQGVTYLINIPDALKCRDGRVAAGSLVLGEGRDDTAKGFIARSTSIVGGGVVFDARVGNRVR